MRELHPFELFIFIELVELVLVPAVPVQCVREGFICFQRGDRGCLLCQ